MKSLISVWITIGYVVVVWTLFMVAASASDYSYAIWAGAGIASSLLMLLGAVASFCVFAVAALTQNGRLVIPGMILAGGCVLPLLLILCFVA